MGNVFKYSFIALAAFCCVSAIGASHFKKEESASAASSTFVINGSTTITDSKITYGGNQYWVTANSSSGITFDRANNNINFIAGGYIENLSAIYGITQIKVQVVSGSLKLFYGWDAPSSLEVNMYDYEVIIGVGTSTYSFANKPTYFRILANEAATIKSIQVVNNNNAYVDSNSESIEKGLENLYVDCGSLNTYANTCFTTDDTKGLGSLRSLKVTFKNTKNNYFVLSPQRDKNAGNIDFLPDLSYSTLSLYMKSWNLNDDRIRVKAIGEGWTGSNYFLMEKEGYPENGWQKYVYNFGYTSFQNSDKIIRLNFDFPGVNSTTKKSNSVVYLDKIQISRNFTSDIKNSFETLDDGLENIIWDKGDSTMLSYYDHNETFGSKSNTSLAVVPNQQEYPNTSDWKIALETEKYPDYVKFNEGTFSFDYKPINISNKTTVKLQFIKDWSDSGTYRTTQQGQETTDGWYKISFDLKQTGFKTENTKKFIIGFTISNAEKSNAKVFIDNIRISKTGTENFTDGWENMVRDEPWESCNASYDEKVVNSSQSSNSLKLDFKGVAIDSITKGCAIISPAEQKINLPHFNNGNTLSAYFMFSNITNKTVRFFIVDDYWNCLYYDLTPVQQTNGWYKIEVSKSYLTSLTPIHKTNGAKFTDIIRIGFGFPGLTNENKNSAVVWIDDIQWTGGATKPAANCSYATIYTPRNSENVYRTKEIDLNRVISQNMPLSFTAARNSVEGGEIVIKPTKDITYANFLPGKLINTDGSGTFISSKSFDVMFAKYIYNNKSNEIEHGVAVGDYPDALVPIDRIIAADEARISKYHNQLIWVNANVGKNIKPGTYLGKGALILNNSVFEIPMRVIVKNYTLTDENHSRSSFLIFYDQMRMGEGFDYYDENKLLLRKSYYNFIVDHRINPDQQFDADAHENPEDFANYIHENVAKNPKVSSYKIPIGKQDVADTEAYRSYFEALINKQKEIWDKEHLDLFDCVYLNVMDEPKLSSFFETEELLKIRMAIENAYDKTKNLLNGYPYQLQESFRNLRNIVAINRNYSNSKISGIMKDFFNTPCPEFVYLDTQEKRNVYQNNYKSVWWYGCTGPNTPYPSLHADVPSFYPKIASIMQYYYGIEGELYWAVNYTSDKKEDRLAGGKYDSINKVWEMDCWTTNGLTYGGSAGDGRLLYPGHRYNILGPITTLRMEQLRMSRQDYEYLYDLDQNIAAINKTLGTQYQRAPDMFSSYYSAMFNGTKILSSCNSALMDSYHEALLNYLQDL